MPVDSKLENWNKENYPTQALPISPERPAHMKFTQPRIVLKSLEKGKYSYQADDSSGSNDEEENMAKPKKVASSSPLKQFNQPPRKVAKFLFAVHN